MNFTKFKQWFYVVIGFLLSPLSWWNDLFINIPLAYLFAIPFGLISKSLFFPAMIIGYYITNILGIILMHQGIAQRKKDYEKPNLAKTIIVMTAYTLLIVLLIYFNIIQFPTEYF